MGKREKKGIPHLSNAMIWKNNTTPAELLFLHFDHFPLASLFSCFLISSHCKTVKMSYVLKSKWILALPAQPWE